MKRTIILVAAVLLIACSLVSCDLFGFGKDKGPAFPDWLVGEWDVSEDVQGSKTTAKGVKVTAKTFTFNDVLVYDSEVTSYTDAWELEEDECTFKVNSKDDDSVYYQFNYIDASNSTLDYSQGASKCHKYNLAKTSATDAQ